MPDSEEILTVKQRRMITALMGSTTIGQACTTADVSRSSLDRWLKQPEFMAALRSAEGQAIGEAARSLLSDLLANHDTLRKIRDDETQSPSVRLRAAVELDAAALRWHQAGNIEERLLEIERRLQDAIEPNNPS